MMRRVVAAIAIAALPSMAIAQGRRAQQPTGPGSSQQGIKTHDDLQPAQLPTLPNGMTIESIVQGDSIFHGKGNCFACHGIEAECAPAAGDALTVSLSYAQPEWRSIDSLVESGIPQVLTRSPIQMPPRGGKSNLSAEEVRRVAAYVWAISQTRGEPWPGGHPSHVGMVPAGASKGTASRVLIRELPRTRRPPR